MGESERERGLEGEGRFRKLRGMSREASDSAPSGLHGLPLCCHGNPAQVALAYSASSKPPPFSLLRVGGCGASAILLMMRTHPRGSGPTRNLCAPHCPTMHRGRECAPNGVYLGVASSRKIPLSPRCRKSTRHGPNLLPFADAFPELNRFQSK